MSTSRGASGRGATSRAPRGTLTRERLVATALALADERGLDAVTIRGLAERLGVKPMAIYHHVASKDEILDAIVDQVFAEIDVPAAGEPWRAAMHRRASSARQVLLRHPWSIALLEARASSAVRPAMLRHHDAVIGSLRDGGLSPALVALAFALLDSYVYGFVMQEVTMPATTPQHLPDEVAGLEAALSGGTYPNLAALATEHFLQPGYDFADEFDRGLELVLDGLEARAGAARS